MADTPGAFIEQHIVALDQFMVIDVEDGSGCLARGLRSVESIAQHVAAARKPVTLTVRSGSPDREVFCVLRVWDLT